MSKVSVCIIVRDEESILEKSLASIADIADEIIITDTGSTDNTIQIAKKFTNKIYHFPWIDDFSSARNFTTQYAQYKYILRWDADFLLHPEDLAKVIKLKNNDFNNADLVYFTWNVEFDKQNNAVKSIPNFFFYKREKFHWEFPIHNLLVLNDKNSESSAIQFPDIRVDHLKDRELKSYRYNQTKRILEKTLAQDPDNDRLQLNYAEHKIFTKDFESAIDIFQQVLSKNIYNTDKLSVLIENLVMCYFQSGRTDEAKILVNQYYEKLSSEPRFILVYADATSISDPFGAKEFYLKYIQNPLIPENTLYGFDYYRHIEHARKMLSNLT